jgi:NodT family efflux transporter outer membrane factor (OMF) lipoprotein
MVPMRKAVVVPVALALSGCLVGPDYAVPELPPVGDWQVPLEGGASATDPGDALARWWLVLGDPLLSELVERAGAGNLALREAEARVRQARAQRSGARASLFPEVGVGGSTNQSHSAGQAGGSFSGVPTGSTGDRSLYQVGLDASWELDLFGGLRREAEAAGAELAASQADLEGVRVSLAAELALAYVELRAFQARLAIASANLELQAETAQIAHWRSEAGLTTALDVEQARASLEQTRAELPLLQVGIGQAQRRIAVLIGELPGTLAAQLDAPAPIPLAPPEVAVGVPAAALLRRPDLQRAERQLAAETARVGAAEALRYPSVSLLGSLGLDALDGEELFSSGSGSSSFGSSLSQVILDFGRIRAQIDAQDALREQALARFRSALLVALEEVENALVDYARVQERRLALAEAAGAAQRAAALSRTQYESGLVDFEAVLVAERSLFSLQDQLAASEGEVASNLIRLYKALGGGWAPGAGG